MAVVAAGAAALGPSAAAHAWPGADLSAQVAGAPQRVGARDLTEAQARVDAALRLRKQRFAAWQRAVEVRDVAATDVAALKQRGTRGSLLEDALRRTLVLDEEAARARSAVLAAESEVSRAGAELLRLYDVVLIQQRRAVEAVPSSGPARAQAVALYRQVASQRDAVRAALAPVLAAETVDAAELPPGVDLDARPEDDVEALLEKADLARDLEQRFLRQAQEVRRRIVELEDERAVARSVGGMVGQSQLFDEEDRRLLFFRTETVRPPPSSAQSPGGLRGGPESNAPAFAPGAPELASEGAPAAEGPAPGDTAVPVAPVASTSVVRGEQVIGAQAAGNIVDVQASMESLRALEARLKAQARLLREKSQRLKTEIEQQQP